MVGSKKRIYIEIYIRSKTKRLHTVLYIYIYIYIYIGEMKQIAQLFQIYMYINKQTKRTAFDQITLI